jgi:hypothetical protein
LHKRDSKKAEGKMTGMIEAEIRGEFSSLGNNFFFLIINK